MNETSSSKRATERCKRLLGLAENSTTSTNRTLAVNRLLHLLRTQQKEERNNSMQLTDTMLRRCASFVRSTSWDVRVTGTMLLGGMITLAAATSAHCQHIQEEQQHCSAVQCSASMRMV